MTSFITIIDDSLNNDKPNSVIIFEGEKIFDGRDISPEKVIDLLELGKYVESILYRKVKTADLENWEEWLYD